MICQALGRRGCNGIALKSENPTIVSGEPIYWPNYSNVEYQGLICPMSSPFAIFRKNQKLWLAGAVFIAVVAFVLTPSGGGGKSSRNVGPNPVIASWTGGSIRSNDLRTEWDQVILANRFLRKLAIDVRAKGGMPKVPEFAPDLSLVGITSDQDDEGPSRIIERKLLVAEANRMGIHFDDASVKKFLELFVDGRLDGKEIKKALFDSTDGRMNLFDFNRVMREELAKNEVLRLAGTGLRFEDRREARTLSRPPLTTPGKNWQDYLKFNRTAKIQAFPVFVNDFEAQVKNKPTEAEYQEIYKEGKEIIRSRSMVSTQPAFMRPQTSNFEYLSINVDKIITEQMALVPEDTLKAEYERRVKEKQFRVPIAQEAVGTPTGSTPPATTDPAAPAPTTPAESTNPSPTTTEPAKTEPAATEPAATEKPLEKAPEATPSADKPPVLDEPKPTAFSTRADSKIKLVSFQEEKPAATEPPVQTPAADTKGEPAQTEPSQSTPAASTTEPAAKPDTSSVLEVTGQPAPTPALPTFPQTGANAQGADVADSTPMRTKTFEEVKDQIARDQAFGPANKIIEDRISEVMGAMSIFESELKAYKQAVASKVTNVKAPSPLDLAKLGAEFGFEYATTGLVDQESIQGSPIGSSFVMGQRPFSFVALVNARGGVGELYTPVTSRGFTGGDKRYVSWKIDETLPITPALDSVRTQVEEVWRKQQAFKLAESRAKELASKVGATSTLKDSLGTAEEKALILEPANFSWFNPMFARAESRLQLSNVELLQPVDNAFMEAVFACKTNETTIASDSNKTVYYVVQVLELTPAASLLERFATAPFEGVSTVSQLESDRALQPWFQNLRDQIGFREMK